MIYFCIFETYICKSLDREEIVWYNYLGDKYKSFNQPFAAKSRSLTAIRLRQPDPKGERKLLLRKSYGYYLHEHQRRI